MQIICRKKLHFQDHEIIDNTKTGEKIALLKYETIVSPSVNPQTVPNWISKTDLFNLCVDDGSISVVQVLSTPKTQGKTSKKKEDDPTSGWGAKPGAGLPNGNDIGDKNVKG